MKEYLIPFLSYVFLLLTLQAFLPFQIAYAINAVVTAGLLIFFWKKYNLKLSFNWLSILYGIIIAIVWVAFAWFFSAKGFIPESSTFLYFKLFGFILVAPIVEELFTRSFLNRMLINYDFKSVPIGKFTGFSFIMTALFFGMSHSLWLAGISSGILLNLVLYKTKKIENAIIAHFIANLSLAVFVVISQNWKLW